MPFANDIQINKFRSKVEKTDPYDVNVALNFALQEYFEAKRNLIKRLTKYFHKELEGMILDSDEFNYVIDVAG